jgi:hypothetical protein
MIGDGIGAGIQWSLFRYQSTYLGISFITVLKDLNYILTGVIAGKTAISLTIWFLGALLLIFSLLLHSYNYYINIHDNRITGFLVVGGGTLLIIADFIQYHISLNGPAGFCIPLGIPIILGYGWLLYHESQPVNFIDWWNSTKSVINRHQLLILLLTIFIIFSLTTSMTASGDTFPASVLPYSILHNQTITGDPYQSLFVNNPNVSYAFINIHGHYFSVFSIVLPTLILPLYEIQNLIFTFLSIPVSLSIITVTGRVVSAIIVTLACLFLYLTLKDIVSSRIAIISTFIFAFATETWAISSQALWQHGLIELLLALMLYIIVKNERSHSTFNIIGLGIISGLFIFARPSDAVLIIPVFLYIVFSCREKIHYYLVAGVLSGFPFLMYNLVNFSSVVGGSVTEIPLLNFNYQFMINYLGLLVAPNKGLFVYSPILILSVVGYFKLNQIKNQQIKWILQYFGPVLLLDILIYSLYSDWIGGYSYGPRYLTGILPILAIYLAIFLEFAKNRHVSSVKKYCVISGIFVLILISIIIQLIGVFYFPNITDRVIGSENPWDIHNSQIVKSFQDGSQNTTGLYVVLIPPLQSYRLYSTVNSRLTLNASNNTFYGEYIPFNNSATN